jgi:hypothetical protein
MFRTARMRRDGLYDARRCAVERPIPLCHEVDFVKGSAHCLVLAKEEGGMRTCQLEPVTITVLPVKSVDGTSSSVSWKNMKLVPERVW